MIRYFISVVGIFLAFSAGSFAGIPTKETVTCPVGGETFTITGTLSCSTQRQRTMSFRKKSSCDFITRLPVCPGNGLPIYMKFSDEQVSVLEEFLKTEKFKELKKLPPWHRAYGVAQNLGQSGTETTFALLLSAMWFESEEFFGSETTIDHFLQEAENEMLRTDAENQPFLNAIVAYALSAAGRFDEANERLNSVADAPGATEYLLQYVSAIRACQTDMTREGCRPQDPFNP